MEVDSHALQGAVAVEARVSSLWWCLSQLEADAAQSAEEAGDKRERGRERDDGQRAHRGRW